MRLKESLLSRRGFLTGLIYGSLAFLAAYIADPVIRFIFHKKKIPLPKAVTLARADIQNLARNSAAYFKYGHLPGILLKTETGQLRAFSAKCTHLDCNVQYMPQSKKFFCACHEGYFDDMGQNIAGPPPTPLPQFRMIEDGDVIVVSYIEDTEDEAEPQEQA